MDELSGRVLGDFQLTGLLGQGGMGAVYRARQLSLDREVAVKVIRPEYLFRPDLVERFRREILALARLSHPNVVKVFEAGEAEGISFFAMELLEGRSLAEIAGHGKPLRISQVRTVSEGLLSAVAYLHSQGLLHRDIKPANVIVAHDGRARLMDFGLVKDVHSTMLTEKGSSLGTPRFMSPEVLLGGDATPSSDLYQIGMVVYTMLTGVTPWGGFNLNQLVAAFHAGRSPSLREVRPDLPPSLDAVVTDLLSIDSSRRPADARSVWNRLDAALREATFEVEEAATEAGPGEPQPAEPDVAVRRGESGKRSRPVKAVSAPVEAARSRPRWPTRSIELVPSRQVVALTLVWVVALGAALVWSGLLDRFCRPIGSAGTLRPASPASPVATAQPGARREVPCPGSPAPLDRSPVPGRRVLQPRGMTFDATGTLYLASPEGLSWFDGRSWRSRLFSCAPQSVGILCADPREGVWLRIWSAPDSGRSSETGSAGACLALATGARGLGTIRDLAGIGQPTHGVIDEGGELTIVAGGRLFTIPADASASREVSGPGGDEPITGVFRVANELGVWSTRRAWIRRSGAWSELARLSSGRIRQVSRIAESYWICTDHGIYVSEKGRLIEGLSGTDVSTVLPAPSGDGLLVFGSTGVFSIRLPILSGPRAHEKTPLPVASVPHAASQIACRSPDGDVWFSNSEPRALVRVSRDGARVDLLTASNPEESARELDAIPPLLATHGVAMPFCWLDGSVIASGNFRTIRSVDVQSRTTASIAGVAPDAWPMYLASAPRERALYAVWRKHETEDFFLDRFDLVTGKITRIEGLPGCADGPIEVAEDGAVIYQGPFIPTLLLLREGVYVRYHGLRPSMGEIAGPTDFSLSGCRVRDRVASRWPPPPDFDGGPLALDASRRELVYRSRDARVIRRRLESDGGFGPPFRITFPPGVDERQITELMLSPGGGALAFVSLSRASGRSSLWVLDLAGGSIRELGSYLFDYGQPRFSPDGKRLAFVRRVVDRTEAHLAFVDLP